jgi:hypothetical protein
VALCLSLPHTEFLCVPNSINQNTWFFEVLCYYMNVFLVSSFWRLDFRNGWKDTKCLFPETPAHEAHILLDFPNRHMTFSWFVPKLQHMKHMFCWILSGFGGFEIRRGRRDGLF